MGSTFKGSRNIKKIHAFKLRAVGYSNEKIALELGMKVSTVQTNFSRGWKIEYEDFEREGIAKIKRGTLLQLYALQATATDVLQQILLGGSEVGRLRAADMLLRANLRDRIEL